MDFQTKTVLGRTGVKVGRLGVAGGFGADADVFEEAFEKGCNYFYWGVMRKNGMARAIQNIAGSGRREDLMVTVQSFSRSAIYLEHSLKKALKKTKLDYADVLLLGYHNKMPSKRIMDRALALKEKGLIKYLGLSSHTRLLFPELAESGMFDLFHIRYNAAHRGAEQEVFPALNGGDQPGIVTFTATRWGELLNQKKMPINHESASGSECYRFVLTNPDVDVCIAGPKNMDQMREALTSLDLGPLDDEEMTRMKGIGDFIHANSKRRF